MERTPDRSGRGRPRPWDLGGPAQNRWRHHVREVGSSDSAPGARVSSDRRFLADEPDGSEAFRLGSLPSRSARPRALVPRPRFQFAKHAANDTSAQHPSEELGRLHGLRLDEMIREIVRAEVRAEVARALAIASAQPTHVSVAEYAATRSISVSTVRNAIRSGRLPALRIGAHRASGQSLGRGADLDARYPRGLGSPRAGVECPRAGRYGPRLGLGRIAAGADHDEACRGTSAGSR